MFRKATLATFAVAALAASLAAQPKSNFTGTWKLNTTKSDFGMLPGPESRTDVIDHNDPVLKVTTTQENQQGKATYALSYTTDGKEVTNKQGPREVKSTLNWDAAGLVVNSKLTFNDNDVNVKGVWTLSPDGKTLTQNVHFASPMGETDQKLVFDKVDGATAAASSAPPAVTGSARAASIASTGPKPNYSGTWKLNVAKSDFGPLPGPDSRTDIVDHQDPAIKIATAQKGGPQGDQEYTMNLTTDGKETMSNIGGLDIKSILNWAGPNLVVNTSLKIQDNDIGIKSIWLLSDDGKTLTQNIHITSPMGEMDQKWLYDKQ